MPSITALLNPEPPRCPNHPVMLAERFGVCCVCEMTTHRHVSGFRLITDWREHYWPAWVPYRTEAEAYDEGIYDDD